MPTGSFTLDEPLKKPTSPFQRRWQSLSTRWRRIILATLILFLAIVVALIVSLAVVFRPRPKQHLPSIAGDGQTDNATASEFSDPPVKLGLLTNFPDPALYYDTASKIWYAYATNQAAGILDLERSAQDLSHLSLDNVQLAKSADFVTWKLADATSDPLPHPGAWTRQGTTDLSSLPYHDGEKSNDTTHSQVNLNVPRANVWSPELLHRPSDGSWVLYYAAANGTGGVHCIGAAVSPSPEGPFEPGEQAIICPRVDGGAIDPAVFIDESDNNAIYLVYKVDGDIRGHGGECNNMKEPIVPTPLMLQRMEDDGVTVDRDFAPQTLLDRIAEDGPLIEAPTLIKADTNYFLFYSSGCTRFPDYSLRYAYASSLGGPYTRAEPAFLATKDLGLTAPGSATIRFAHDAPNLSPEGTTGDSTLGSWKLALHGRVNTTIGGVRAFFTAGLEFDGTTVRLVDGSTAVI